MSYSYLIKIDTENDVEKDDILKYIMGQINEDEMAENIEEIKCISSIEHNKLCRTNLKNLGSITKIANNDPEICTLCDECYNAKQLVFQFNDCNHKYHKKCIFKLLKTGTKTVCFDCKEKYIPNILDFK